MTNFEVFKDAVKKYLSECDISISCDLTLHEASLNNDGKVCRYLYNGDRNLTVVSMDILAKQGYKAVKGVKDPRENPINTVDEFLINKENEWYLIEFKDCVIKADKQAVKDNIIKKAYANWYMIMDMFYTLSEKNEKCGIFDINNPIRFAKEHVHYILVCSGEENPKIYNQVKSQALLKQNYTPPFMRRLKDYLFKDAYVYTENFFEEEFVKKFAY